MDDNELDEVEQTGEERDAEKERSDGHLVERLRRGETARPLHSLSLEMDRQSWRRMGQPHDRPVQSQESTQVAENPCSSRFVCSPIAATVSPCAAPFSVNSPCSAAPFSANSPCRTMPPYP